MSVASGISIRIEEGDFCLPGIFFFKLMFVSFQLFKNTSLLKIRFYHEVNIYLLFVVKLFFWAWLIP